MLTHHAVTVPRRGPANGVRVLIVLILGLLLAGCGDLLAGPAFSFPDEPPTVQPARLTAIATATATRTPQARARATATRSPAQATPRLTVSPTVSQTVTALPRTSDGLRVVTLDELPKEARTTLALIEQGGPFPYRQDGAVFQNRERKLPRQRSGYYHEYTVKTPGSPDRGARRIVTGAGGEIYYTADHYNTFVRVLLP